MAKKAKQEVEEIVTTADEQVNETIVETTETAETSAETEETETVSETTETEKIEEPEPKDEKIEEPEPVAKVSEPVNEVKPEIKVESTKKKEQTPVRKPAKPIFRSNNNINWNGVVYEY